MSFPARARFLTGLSVAMVLAANLAGVGGIVIARRAAVEEAERAFRDETEGRARDLESLLSTIRADLAFIAASSPLARGDTADAAQAAGGRAGTESALLLFLRAHPQVVRVLGRSPSGEPFVHVGRRGGVPLLWVSANPTGLEGAAVAPDRPRPSTTLSVDVEGDRVGEKLTLETELDPASLLPQAEPDHAPTVTCRLRDSRGGSLAPHGAPRAEAPGSHLHAAASVAAEDWQPPGPWRLVCEQTEGAAASRIEAVSSRYRATLTLNVVVMGLTLLLGGFVVQQTRRRERLEARSREETRVRELERQLFHAERLTTVGRLAAGIAHEINNPLEGMANWLSLTRTALGKGDSAAAAQYLDRIKEGLDRAAGIVRQVLAHSDPAKAPHEPIDLNQVLRETQEFVRSRKEFGAISFGLTLSPGPLLVRGSPVMLGQVAVNLILNACEAQPSGGEVRVSSTREGADAIAEFQDRGPGVAEEDRPRIFEPFFSTKDSTGLGLSICHSIVQQHGGELSVSPRAGGGAVFRIKLPALGS